MRKRRIFAYELMACSLMMTGIPAYASTTTSETKQEAQSTNEQPPQKPDGEAPSGSDGQQGEKPDGEPPKKPDGEKPSGEMPSGEMPSGEAPDGQPGGGPGGSGGASSGVDSYDAATEYTEDTETDGENYTSTGTDENAVLVSNGANVILKNSTIDRTSEDSTGGDNSSFYGVGAALLTTEGITYIDNATITTDAKGGAGVFAHGDGVVYIADSTITTKQDTSGGLHAAGGGTLYAWDVTAETDGVSSAAIRSDRGGGTMVVDGGNYTSNGTDSPAVYCTANIAVNDAALTANGSEAVCIEGLNSLYLFGCDITGNMQDLDQNDTTWTFIVYQSMSGDSEIGSSTMQLVGGSVVSENGGLIYTTNTECDILLSDVDITYSDDSEFFLKCTGNDNERSWGTSGSNGSDCVFTAENQEMEGDVIWDSISDLDFYMTDGSTLTGAIVDDESYAGEGGDGYCNLYLSEDSTWVVDGDSTLTNLYSEGTITDADGNTVSVVGTDGTVYVEGTSEYTITVVSYEETADLSGASSTAAWADYEVERPEELGGSETESESESSDTDTDADASEAESTTEAESSAK